MKIVTPPSQNEYISPLWDGMPPSAGELGEFLGHTRVRVFAKKEGKVMGTWFWDCDRVDDLNMDGWDIYVVLNPTHAKFCGIKPSDCDIAERRWVLVDYDLKTPYHEIPTEDMGVGRKIILNYADARLGIWTGAGYQRWYKYQDGTEGTLYSAMETIRRCSEAWGYNYNLPHIKVDNCTTDASRLARWPQTVNWKTGFRGQVLTTNSWEITPPIAPDGWPNHPKPHNSPTKYTNLSALAPRLNATSSRFLLDGVDHAEESRHKAAYATARCLREQGVSYDIAKYLVLQGAQLCRHGTKPLPLSGEEAEHSVKTAYNAK